MQFTLTRSAARPQAACCTRRPRRTGVVVRADSSASVPPNVAEARSWIAAWRKKQQASGAPPSAPSTPPPSAPPASPPATTAAASAPTNGKPSGTAPCKSFSDGTLLFTADALTTVQYKDVKLDK